MVVLIVRSPSAAATTACIKRLILPLAGLLSETGVDFVIVLHLGVDVVGLDVGVGVLVDVGGAVGRLEQALGWTGGIPALTLLSDQPISPLSQTGRLGRVLEVVVIAGDGEALVDGGGVDIVNGVMRIKHHTVIILDVSSIMPSL